jgi:hypothetical protein
VTHILLEIASDQQDKLDHFLQTGEGLLNIDLWLVLETNLKPDRNKIARTEIIMNLQEYKSANPKMSYLVGNSRIFLLILNKVNLSVGLRNSLFSISKKILLMPIFKILLIIRAKRLFCPQFVKLFVRFVKNGNKLVDELYLFFLHAYGC